MNLIDKFKTTRQAIKKADNILVVGHLRPDGDAIAACCAVLEILKTFKKKAWGFCSGNLPDFFNFLPNFYQINSSVKDLKNKINLDIDSENFLDFFDLIFVLDCGSLARTDLSKEIKRSREKKRPFIIEIDHHPAVDNYADLEIRQPLSASTTELIYDFYQFLDWPLNKDIANCLLTGIVADTGNFFYPNASAKSLKIAANLLTAGANLSKIVKQVVSNKNMTTFKLWGLAMERLQSHPNYSFACSVLTLNDLQAISNEAEEISETLSSIAGFLSNLAGVKATLLLHETAPGMIKGHLRSANPHINIAKLARLLGGGGHPQAAGFALAGKLIKTESGWQVK